MAATTEGGGRKGGVRDRPFSSHPVVGVAVVELTNNDPGYGRGSPLGPFFF